MKFLIGMIIISFSITSSYSVSLNQCDDQVKIPSAIRIIGCDDKTSCVIPGFSQPTIQYEVDFKTQAILKNVVLEARINVENIELFFISNWKESPTIGPVLPLKKNKIVTYSSKIHYIGYEWWIRRADKKPLKAVATIRVKDGNKSLYCAKVPLEFTFCVKDCPEIFEEYKDAKKPLNIPPYKPAAVLPLEEPFVSEENNSKEKYSTFSKPTVSSVKNQLLPEKHSEEKKSINLPTNVPSQVPPFEELSESMSNLPWDWVFGTPKLP